MDEQQLIAGCKSENRLAQRELYEKYARRMLAVCLRYVNDMETARDLLQDGFVRVFTNIHSYTGSGSFEGWLRKIFVMVLWNICGSRMSCANQQIWKTRRN